MPRIRSTSRGAAEAINLIGPQRGHGRELNRVDHHDLVTAPAGGEQGVGTANIAQPQSIARMLAGVSVVLGARPRR